jgi:uncharacterized lipoprotein YajG
MLRIRLFIVVFLSLIGLTACASNTTSGLSYAPPATVAATAAPTIAAVTATDQRKEAPNRLATIMGGFGNPLKVLDTPRPVKDEVAAAFTDGLRARGLLAGDGHAPLEVQLLIRKFDADMIMGSTARIDLDLTVIDQASHQVVYRDTATDQRSDFAFFATGIFADIKDLQKLAQTVLDATVDRMLDKPEFRAAIARRPAATS